MKYDDKKLTMLKSVGSRFYSSFFWSFFFGVVFFWGGGLLILGGFLVDFKNQYSFALLYVEIKSTKINLIKSTTLIGL